MSTSTHGWPRHLAGSWVKLNPPKNAWASAHKEKSFEPLWSGDFKCNVGLMLGSNIEFNI